MWLWHAYRQGRESTLFLCTLLQDPHAVAGYRSDRAAPVAIHAWLSNARPVEPAGADHVYIPHPPR
eukprot:COSAG04_NODE_1555_length_6371_cov_32.975446_5_plen_66_part_00